MTVVHIPALLLDLTGHEDRIEIEMAPDDQVSVRFLLAEVERRHPGVEARLLDGDSLVAGIAVFVDGEQSRLGLREKVAASSEVHFIPPAAGG